VRLQEPTPPSTVPTANGHLVALCLSVGPEKFLLWLLPRATGDSDWTVRAHLEQEAQNELDDCWSLQRGPLRECSSPSVDRSEEGSGVFPNSAAGAKPAEDLAELPDGDRLLDEHYPDLLREPSCPGLTEADFKASVVDPVADLVDFDTSLALVPRDRDTNDDEPEERENHIADGVGS
jgi:hypothetical protein